MSLDVDLECPDCHGCDEHYAPSLWHANITHNLVPMARAAGIYDEVWRPDEHEVATADQMIAPLDRGIAALEAESDRYHVLNPENGWGSYAGFLAFLRDYLEACRKYPTARVRVSR